MNLKEHQQTLEKLADEFHGLAKDASIGDLSPTGFATYLDLIRTIVAIRESRS